MDENSLEPSDSQVVSARQRNALHSKTSVFPPEILSLIFQYASGRWRRYSPIPLGSVSHAWRQVAWSTPQLWAELSIIAPCSGAKNAQNLASLLDLFFKNVRNFPIALHIEFGAERVEIPEYAPIAQIFFKEENLRKLGCLQLNDAPDSWLSRLDGPFPQLVKIGIFVCDWVDSAFAAGYPFLLNAPMLREISLECLSAPSPRTSWSMITVLKLANIFAPVALQFLFRCPNLVEFYIIPDSDDEEEEEDLSDIPNTLTLPHLETLSSSFYHSSDLFLHRLRLPALHSLIWDQHRTPATGVVSPGVWAFVENLSSAPLTAFRLFEVLDVDINFLNHIYRQTPRIERLFLHSCNEATLCTILSSLTSGSTDGGSTDKILYWTKLKRLEFRSWRVTKANRTLEVRLSETFGDLVADLLIGRASADFSSSLCVDLAFSKGTKVVWTSGTKERLRELDRSGAKVQLLENGKRMGWL